MVAQNCMHCDEALEPGYSVCWRCGTHIDGSPPNKNFVPVNMTAPPSSGVKHRDLACLRCGSPMTAVRRMQLHEGTRMQAFLHGGLDEPFVNRESFDTYACERCGKVEFFLAE
ncbi:MAG: hypothetical protein ABL934_18025 [Lysobacteraceae bacterium]